MNAGQRMHLNLGERTFLYEGLQSAADPGLTAWRFEVYGAVRLGQSSLTQPLSTNFLAITGRNSFLDRLEPKPLGRA